MKKVICSLLASICVCTALNAQVFEMKPQPRRGYTNSKTIVTVQKNGGMFAGWHGVVEGSAGVHVYSGSHAVNPMTTASATGLYEFSNGFVLGAALGAGFYTEGSDLYPEARIMPVVGYMFTGGPGSVFFTVQPGIASVLDDDGPEVQFSADIKLGYRYMFKPHFGIAVSTGISGTVEWWLSVPVTVGIVF